MKQLVLLVSLSSLTGCMAAIGPGPSAGGRMQSGREITVRSDHWYRTIVCRSVSAEAEAIRVGRRKVLVEPEQISVDGDVVASISPVVREVTVAESNDQLQVIADGEIVYSTEF